MGASFESPPFFPIGSWRQAGLVMSLVSSSLISFLCKSGRVFWPDQAKLLSSVFMVLCGEQGQQGQRE